ncbi:MAG: glycerol-3-phosphate 1-O-acyltransferase PlsY [Gammaproteobacteria bacterium]
MDMILGIVLVVLGYLCGSLASAVIVCRIMKLPDPRKQGSGNPGATNVLRLGGKKAAALTLAGDVIKGAVPVLLAHLLSDSPVVLASTAVAAIVGHMYPVFFQFKGGKGVATTLGAVAALVYPVALFMGAVWVLTAMATRYASLASLAAAVAAPLFALVFIQEPATILALVIIAALLVYRHRENIQRLRDGIESEINL